MVVDLEHVTRTARHDVVVAAPVPPPSPAVNPALIGIPSFLVGTTALALLLLQYNPSGGAAPLLAILIMATAVGQLVASVWAIRIGNGPVAAIYGIFQGFFFSFGALQLGLLHEWFGPGINAMQAVSAFTLCWLVLVVVLTLATLRLPVVFTALFVLIDFAFALSYLAYLGSAPSATLLFIAGIVTLGYTAVGVYLFVDAMNQATGGRALPMGAPLLK